MKIFYFKNLNYGITFDNPISEPGSLKLSRREEFAHE